MTRATIVGGVFIAGLLILILGFLARRSVPKEVEAAAPAPLASTTEVQPGFLYGRIVAVDGDTYEGRLRWGGDQEAFWDDSLKGTKDQNPWALHAPERRGRTREPIEVFGFRIGGRDRVNDRDRPFMARFGDIVRIVRHFKQVTVTLKSGTVFILDRFEAGDIDEGVRVWDRTRGVVDFDSLQIRTIEFLPTPPIANVPDRLHGTVRTRHGDFTGFIQWDRQDCVGADELNGRTGDGERNVRYDAIRSIVRRSRESALVTLRDGQELLLSDTREVGRDSRGINVDDRRYGRVLISWDVFDRVEFSPNGSGSGAGYGDYPAGRPLAGTVTTRDGRRLAGRLVYDFDESENTETLDASSQGIDYSIPFDLITSIMPRGRRDDAQRASIILRTGEELHLEYTGDLGESHGGMLIFIDGRGQPEYVRWADVQQIDLDHRTGTARAGSTR